MKGRCNRTGEDKELLTTSWVRTVGYILAGQFRVVGRRMTLGEGRWTLASVQPLPGTIHSFTTALRIKRHIGRDASPG